MQTQPWILAEWRKQDEKDNLELNTRVTDLEESSCQPAMVRNKQMNTCSFVLLLFLVVKPQVNYFSAKSMHGIWMTFSKENIFILHQMVEKAIPLLVSAAEEESRSKVLHHLTHPDSLEPSPSDSLH